MCDGQKTPLLAVDRDGHPFTTRREPKTMGVKNGVLTLAHVLNAPVRVRVAAIFEFLPHGAMGKMGNGPLLGVPSVKLVGSIASMYRMGGFVWFACSLTFWFWFLCISGAHPKDPAGWGEGLQRIYCDLYCIEDAVRKGDQSILDTLGNMYEKIKLTTKERLGNSGWDLTPSRSLLMKLNL